MAYGDMFDDLFGGARPPRPQPGRSEPVEKGVQLRGRDIDGTYYIRAEDVVGLLEANKVLPKITRLIKSKIRGS